MTNLNKILAIAASALLLLFGGWLWGSLGRWSAQSDLRQFEVRLHAAEGRAFLLQARVDLFEVNFGNASRSLEAARGALDAAGAVLQREGRDEAASAVKDAITSIGEAQQSAARLDQGAQGQVVKALAALARASAAPAR